MSQELTQQILQWVDGSFKYILIFFNLITLVVVYIHKQRQVTKKQHHVLFVTAHPDDEAMFFRPTIRSITKNYFVHLLCLTGKDNQRQQQFNSSTKWLNIYKSECIKHPKLQDSMQADWPYRVIQQIVLKYVSQNNIKAIFTFDSYGVSGHINHKSVSKALQQLQHNKKDLKLLNKKPNKLSAEQSKKLQQIKQNSIKIYHLNSVNIIRKYTGPLQILTALVKDLSWINLNFIDAYKSMALHKSQFVWYRKLWVFFSQYSYANSFSISRIKVDKILSKTIKENSIEEKAQQKKQVTNSSQNQPQTQKTREKDE